MNDLKKAKLRLLGGVGAISDMYNENTYWRSLYAGSSKSVNDIKKEVLVGMGYSGSLGDMEKKYWST